MTLSTAIPPKIVVPLNRRFIRLARFARNSGELFGWHAPFRPTPFLVKAFGLSAWHHGPTINIISLRFMPSTIQVATALVVSDGDLCKADDLLTTRATRGVNRACFDVCDRLGVMPWVVKLFWRFPGNGDAVWIQLRDEMARCLAVYESQEAAK